ITVEQLANIMLKIQTIGCHNLNLVTPTHQIAMIIHALSIAIKDGLNIPIVYNCGGYESVETLQLLNGIVDIYMPDFKYGDDALALKYSGVHDYVKIATDALKEMYKQVGGLKIENTIAIRGVFVRHLVLPNDISRTKKVFEIISSISTEIPVNVMNQYHPAYKAYNYPELSRRISQAEYMKAIEMAKKCGLTIVN
ncbi:MAG TPA: radical SAM protein, partial [Pseudothermotoga sp.]